MEYDLRVTFLSVAQDSRCPTGVTCAWAGNAVLDMDALQGGPFTIRFGPAGTSKDSPAVVELAGFRYEVLKLEPTPSATLDPASYVVTLRVTKIAGS